MRRLDIVQFSVTVDRLNVKSIQMRETRIALIPEDNAIENLAVPAGISLDY